MNAHVQTSRKKMENINPTKGGHPLPPSSDHLPQTINVTPKRSTKSTPSFSLSGIPRPWTHLIKACLCSNSDALAWSPSALFFAGLNTPSPKKLTFGLSSSIISTNDKVSLESGKICLKRHSIYFRFP